MVLYTQEVLGRHVVVEFLVGKGTKPYLGRIHEMKAILLDNGEIETDHLVVFEDGEEHWFDLLEQEKLNALTWVNKRNVAAPPKLMTANKKQSQPQQTPNNVSRNRTKPALLPPHMPPKKTTPAIVSANKKPKPSAASAKKKPSTAATKTTTPPTPSATKETIITTFSKRRVNAPERFVPEENLPIVESKRKKRKATMFQTTTCNKQKKTTTTPSHKKLSPSSVSGTAESPLNVDDKTNSKEDPEWIQEMEYWISNVPHGPRCTIPWMRQARTAINKVKLLAAGNGLTCSSWPEDARFYFGIKVDPSFDIKTMIQEATEHVGKHGGISVKSFTAPLKQLLYFQQYYKLKEVRASLFQSSTPPDNKTVGESSVGTTGIACI